MTKLTICIVNYNAGDYLANCLKSIHRVRKEADIRIVVVDNASVDDSILKAKVVLPQTRFILNRENLGFGKANNQELSQLKTEYVLCLNPDTMLNTGVLTGVISHMEGNPDVGAATCKVVLANGQVDLTAHRGFPTLLASFLYYFLKNDSLYHLTDKDMSVAHEVDAISGSFMMMRRSVLNKVGLFDESYFMYAEDLDLCYRIKQAGYKVMYLPEFKILHYKGISSGLKKHSRSSSSASVETRERSLNAFYETMKIFYKKHYAKNHLGFINWLVYKAIDFKWWTAKANLTV